VKGPRTVYGTAVEVLEPADETGSLVWCAVRLSGDKETRRMQVAIEDLVEIEGYLLTRDLVHLFEDQWWFFDKSRENRAGPYASRAEAHKQCLEYLK
jgi:hypothetical protein